MSTRNLRSRPRPQSDEPPEQPYETEGSQGSEDGIVDKEQTVWDALREEHYEAIEQMPLTLHRQFTLMRELDQQAQTRLQALLPALQCYIQKRLPECPAEISSATANPDSTGSSSRAASSAPHPPSSAVPSTPRTPSSPTVNVDPPIQTKSTRELLAYIASISEELSGASEEKVNLAQAACDSVDRHIRQIDQAIKEQEAAISLGSQPGSSLTPVVLPDLVIVPRWSRVTHVEVSDDDEDEVAIPVNGDGVTVFGATNSAVEAGTKRRRRASKGGGRKASDIQHEASSDKPQRESRSLKILPPKPPRDGDQDPGIYCFCRRALDDHLIGCDNAFCLTEWFHWTCVGVTAEPKGDWFCPVCRKTKGGRRRK